MTSCMLKQILDAKYGYEQNGKLYQTRSSLIHESPNDFNKASLFSYIDFSQVELLITYRQAVKNFLKRISSDNSELHIGYSGGVDSEVILKIALEEKINIRPIIVNLFNTNEVDVEIALNFCSQNQLNPLVINIEKNVFLNELLPEIFYTIESGSYLLAAQVLATKYAPKDSTVIICGEAPTQFYCDKGVLFSVLQEYSIWPFKANMTNHCQIVDPFWDAQVFMSFANYPQIKDRILNAKKFSPWYADLDQLSKECYHSDHEFQNIERRFSLHGWESVKGTFGYNKGIFMGGTPDSKRYAASSRPLVDPNLTSDYIYKILEASDCSDFKLWRLQKSKETDVGINRWSPFDFNQVFYRPFHFDQFISISRTNSISETIEIVEENNKARLYNM
jgi:hypothetical protein